MNKICPGCGAPIEKTAFGCPHCRKDQAKRTLKGFLHSYGGRIALIFLLLGAMAIAYWYFQVRPFAYPTLTRQARKLDIPKRVALSKDQAQIVSFFGYPNDFQIIFDPETGDRSEIWLYFKGNQAYVFKNGNYMTDDELLPEVRASTHITHLRPEEINGLLTEKQITELLGQPTYKTKDKLTAVDNLTVIGYEDAVAMFRGDKMVFFQSRPGLSPLEE